MGFGSQLIRSAMVGYAGRCLWPDGSGLRSGPAAGAASTSSASRSDAVLVAKAVILLPSTSVIRSCAPGWGHVERTRPRIPLAIQIGRKAGEFGDERPDVVGGGR